MNKYTLKFNSPEIEQLYQKNRTKSITQPLYKWFSLGLLLVLLARIISNLIQKENQIAIINSAILSFLLTVMFITAKFKTYSWAITILNVALSFFQITIVTKNYSQDTFLLGGNIMMAHSLLVISNDMIRGIITNILLCVIRMSITTMFSDDRDYQVYSLTIIMAGFYCYLQYRIQFYHRTGFYFGLQDIQWEQLLPNIASDAYVLFTYDENTLKFEAKSSKFLDRYIELNEDKQYQFRQLIRGITLKKQTLERFIFDRIQKKSQQQCEMEMDMLFSKRIIKVQYSEFYIPKQAFLIVIKEYPQIIKVNVNSQQKLRLFVTKFQNILEQIIKISRTKRISSINLNEVQHYCYTIYWRTAYYQKKQFYFIMNPLQFIRRRIEKFNKLQRKVKINYQVDNKIVHHKYNVDRVYIECVLAEVLNLVYLSSEKHCNLKVIQLDLGIITFQLVNADCQKIIEQMSEETSFLYQFKQNQMISFNIILQWEMLIKLRIT